jgi:DNA polymerase-4
MKDVPATRAGLSTRKIVHVDMDCFYAAIEVRERPELSGFPVAVGGSPTGRGVLTTANYEARRFGIRSAMPAFKAMQLCPQLVVLPVRFDLYRAESHRIREIFRSVTPIIEPISLDEAYLDVTHRDEPGGDLAMEIRGRIRTEMRLTASAGIAPNKLLAKIASDINKPDGQYEVQPEEVGEFMADLHVRRLWGVGPATGDRLEAVGVETCGQLQMVSKIELHKLFGSFGIELYDLCRGIDPRPVEPFRPRKSLSTEETFARNLPSLKQCREALAGLHWDLIDDLEKAGVGRPIRKLVVKLKFGDFSRTTAEEIGEEPSLERFSALLGEAFARKKLPVRLIGIGVRFADPVPPDPQMDLPFA